MSGLTSTRIRTTAVKLGLPYLAEALTPYIQRADAAKMGYLGLLDLVLAEEHAVRDDRRFRNALRADAQPRLMGQRLRSPYRTESAFRRSQAPQQQDGGDGALT